MALFDKGAEKQIKGLLNNLKDTVNIVYFTQEFECGSCHDGRMFAEEINSFSSKLNLTVYEFVKDKQKADELGVDKIPAYVILDSNNNDTGIKFYGIPGGYEVNSFMESLLEVSGHKEELPAPIMQRIANINRDIHLQVFVTLT